MRLMWSLDDHQLAGLVVHVHAAGGVGEDQDLHAQPAQHAHGEHDLLGPVALVVGGRAPPSPRPARPATCPAPARPCGRSRSRWGSAGSRRRGWPSACSRLCAKAPRPEPEHQADRRPQRRARPGSPRTASRASRRGTRHSSIPAQQALMKAARLPATIARRPKPRDLAPALGRQAADAADLDGDAGEVREAAAARRRR